MEHMEIEILSSSKDEMEVKLPTMTLVAIQRVYLYKDPSVEFAAWKREHPSEKPILKLKTKGKTVKKAINDAVDAITKDLDKMESEFKKLK